MATSQPVSDVEFGKHQHLQSKKTPNVSEFQTMFIDDSGYKLLIQYHETLNLLEIIRCAQRWLLNNF